MIQTTPNSFAATVGSLIDSATPSKILRLREAGLRPQDKRRVVEETINRVANMAKEITRQKSPKARNKK